MSENGPIGGRSYAGVYRVSGKSDLLAFIEAAVVRCGGRVINSSPPTRAPLLLGVEFGSGERIALAVYAFRASSAPVLGRDPHEHRLQIRYGAEGTWGGAHPVGFDPLGVDATLVLGVDLACDLFIGLGALAYDPLPMGISFEYTDAEVSSVLRDGWHVWERMNRPGRRRSQARVENFETVVGFRPERLLDYARFEREASDLGLDPPLRFRRAEGAATPGGTGLHALVVQFELPVDKILDVIVAHKRLRTAVVGGIAEAHLEERLTSAQEIRSVKAIDQDGQPDFEVVLANGRRALVECKNVAPKPYANGDYKVEVQKTRATQGDPYGRLYRYGQFDIVAACLWSVTGQWEFRFRRATDLPAHADEPTRIAPYQRVDARWSQDIVGVV